MKKQFLISLAITATVFGTIGNTLTYTIGGTPVIDNHNINVLPVNYYVKVYANNKIYLETVVIR